MNFRNIIVIQISLKFASKSPIASKSSVQATACHLFGTQPLPESRIVQSNIYRNLSISLYYFITLLIESTRRSDAYAIVNHAFIG